MKKLIALLLALTLCLGLCACGGAAPEPTTEPVPDITVYAQVPEDWSGIGCWAWLEGEKDAFEAWPGEAMSLSGGWYSVTVPGWIDSVIINGNDGSVQTADLTVEPGKDVWICVESAENATVHYQEPIPDIRVYVQVPEDWNGIGCWAWQEGGEDAFESWPGAHMTRNGDWYEVNVPGWIDRLIINGQDGDVQTADLEVEAGQDVWVHVVNEGYAFVHYEAPEAEQLQEELEKPAQDYSDAMKAKLFRGDYQVTGTKVVTHHERLDKYSTDYVPEELQADNPEEVYYVIFLKNKDKSVGFYYGISGGKSAIKPGIQVQIKAVGSDKVLAESKVFEGGDPPEKINSYHSGRGAEPNMARVESWIQENLPKVLEKTPEELPYVPLNMDALSEKELAALEVRERAEKHLHSYAYAVDWLVDYEGFTREEAEEAVANCGADWKEIALQRAQQMLENASWTYEEMVEYMVDILKFTEEEATYAANNCGADWSAQNKGVAAELLEGQPHWNYGYYSYAGLVQCLVEEKGLTKEEAAAIADSCGLDWKEQALLQAKHLTTDNEDGWGYSERSLGAYLRDKLSNFGYAFTRDEAAYAVENCGTDWKKEAAKAVACMLEYPQYEYTKESIIEELTRFHGFTLEQATYGAEQNGLK